MDKAATALFGATAGTGHRDQTEATRGKGGADAACHHLARALGMSFQRQAVIEAVADAAHPIAWRE